jgi:hypothetical protein
MGFGLLLRQYTAKFNPVFADKIRHFFQVSGAGHCRQRRPGILCPVRGSKRGQPVLLAAVGRLGHYFAGRGVFYLNNCKACWGNQFTVDELLIGTHGGSKSPALQQHA